MCLTGGKITVALVTAHVPLAEVAGLLRPAEIVRVGRLLGGLSGSPGRRFALASRVAGLNPHAGEGGDLGSEEIRVICPAVQTLRRRMEGSGGSFGSAFAGHRVLAVQQRASSTAFLCMYHDQGLIPLKLHAFDRGVNVTLGLPFPRTSPDHGTAFDIAGKGIARPESMIAAIRLACELAAGSGSSRSPGRASEGDVSAEACNRVLIPGP